MNSLTGLHITNTVKAESPEHIAEILQDASDADIPVLPLGGGACIATGNAASHDFLALDISGLTGVIEYVPTDMTASFLAGTPIRDVRQVLAENGQELPIDLAEDDPGTIGGLVATGFSGPRRYGQGTLKDLLIGCEYVRGDGLLAKAGGMTVKNVSGFEISRMLHGSWGALAVLTRVNLKVIPRPRADRTLIWRDENAEAALDRQLRLLIQFPGAIALQTVQRSEGWDTAIRFTGRDSAVDDYERQATGLEGQPVAIESQSDIWIPLPGSVDQPQLVVSGTVESSKATALNLIAGGLVTDVSVSLGIGTIRVRLHSDSLATTDLEQVTSNLWMIEGGNNAWKREMSVWGPDRADRTVMRSIKQQFDPANILNRDRLFI